jgi:hypothetical protein
VNERACVSVYVRFVALQQLPLSRSCIELTRRCLLVVGGRLARSLDGWLAARLSQASGSGYVRNNSGCRRPDTLTRKMAYTRYFICPSKQTASIEERCSS